MNELRSLEAELRTCNYWLEYYEDAHNSYAFDEWWVKRENVKRKIKEMLENG